MMKRLFLRNIISENNLSKDLNPLLTLTFSILLLVSPPSLGGTSPKRIQSVLFDKGEPHRIFLTPGLGTVLVFPCFVTDGFIGDESQAMVRFSPTTKRNLLLSLKSTSSHATNLIVRCENQTSHYVFDIIPSRQVHQDVLEISSSYGRPELISPSDSILKSKEVSSPNSDLNLAVKRIVFNGPKIIEQSSPPKSTQVSRNLNSNKFKDKQRIK